MRRSTAKEWCLTGLGFNCILLLVSDVTGFDGPVRRVLGILIATVFWIALVAWGALTLRDRRAEVGGSTGVLVRPWVEPLLLVAAVLVGAVLVAMLVGL